MILNVLLYHYNESIHISLICIMSICICCWFYDDRQLLQSLRAMSKQKYEKEIFWILPMPELLHDLFEELGSSLAISLIIFRMAFIQRPCTLSVDVYNQSALFALSVLHDAEDELRETMKTSSSKPVPVEKAIDIPTAGDLGKKATSETVTVSLFKIQSLVPADRGLVLTQSVLDGTDETNLTSRMEEGQAHKVAVTGSDVISLPVIHSQREENCENLKYDYAH